MSKVKIDEYRRKFYDVQVDLDIASFVTKRIYLDELDQYRNDMNKEMLETVATAKTKARNIIIS